MGTYASFVCTKQSDVGESGSVGSQKDGCYFCLPSDLRGPPRRQLHMMPWKLLCCMQLSRLFF